MGWRLWLTVSNRQQPSNGVAPKHANSSIRTRPTCAEFSYISSSEPIFEPASRYAWPLGVVTFFECFLLRAPSDGCFSDAYHYHLRWTSWDRLRNRCSTCKFSYSLLDLSFSTLHFPRQGSSLYSTCVEFNALLYIGNCLSSHHPALCILLGDSTNVARPLSQRT